MAVTEVRGSPALRHYVARENVPPEQARALHHYRIYLRWRRLPRGICKVGICEQPGQDVACLRQICQWRAAALQVHQRLKTYHADETQCGAIACSAPLPWCVYA